MKDKLTFKESWNAGYVFVLFINLFATRSKEHNKVFQTVREILSLSFRICANVVGPASGAARSRPCIRWLSAGVEVAKAKKTCSKNT